MVCFLVCFLPSCFGKDCRWLLRVHGITNWPVLIETEESNTHRGRSRVSKHIQTVTGGGQALRVETRKAATSFPSFSLPAPLSPAAAEGPQPSEELDFLKSSHSNLSEKLNRRLLILVAPRDQVQGRREECSGSWAARQRSASHASCHLLSVARGLLAGKLLGAKEVQAWPVQQEVALR